MTRRHVLYLSKEQEVIMQDIAEMLGLDSPTAAAKHCMMLGLTGMRSQLSQFSQASTLTRMVAATEKMADSQEMGIKKMTTRRPKKSARRYPGPSSTGIQSQK